MSYEKEKGVWLPNMMTGDAWLKFQGEPGVILPFRKPNPESPPNESATFAKCCRCRRSANILSALLVLALIAQFFT